MTCDNGGIDVSFVIRTLKRDSVVLIRNVAAEKADSIIQGIAEALDLGERLRLQAGFAGFGGHRHNIGKYFMTVNRRDDYQFIPPHSEGDSTVNMQLASFYCYENTTDGGETLLMNVNNSAVAWGSLRERVTRAKPGFRPLSPAEIAQVRTLYRLRLPADTLGADDHALAEHQCQVPGLTLVDALARVRQTYSCILERKLYAYWDSVASIDQSAVNSFALLLRQWGLLKEPPGGLNVNQMDNAAPRRVWDSKVDHTSFFRCRITHKMMPGDLTVHNNLTWVHGACNWHPHSGTRNIAAAFA
jgi:hypothetical protein